MGDLLYNKENLFERFGGDASAVKEVTEAYLEEQLELCNLLRTALDGGDRETVRRATHALKGSVLNICAIRASELAVSLEQKVKAGEAWSSNEYEDLFSAVSEVNREIQELYESL